MEKQSAHQLPPEPKSTVGTFVVDAARCTRCGLCVRDCPVAIVAMPPDGSPGWKPGGRESCLHCQHCLAICPTGAVSIDGIEPADCFPLTPETVPSLDQMERLARGRRSCRHYRDADVDPDLVQRLLDVLACAPTGRNVRALTFTVISDRKVMQQLREKVLAAAEAALAAGGTDDAGFLQGAVTAYREHGQDVVLRGAPHLLIVSCPPSTATPREDVALTLAYFELLAQSAGLGTVWCGLFRRACEALPELKTLVGLPLDHEYYTMLFGVPAHRYTRTAKRDGSAAVRRLTLLPDGCARAVLNGE